MDVSFSILSKKTKTWSCRTDNREQYLQNKRGKLSELEENRAEIREMGSLKSESEKIVWAKKSGFLLMKGGGEYIKKINYSVLSKDYNKANVASISSKNSSRFLMVHVTCRLFVCHFSTGFPPRKTISHFQFPDSLWLFLSPLTYPAEIRLQPAALLRETNG